MVKIATIINYCTNDYRFLRFCIQEARRFSKQIIIPVCTNFFNGDPENRDLLDRSYREHPDVQFVEFAYTEQPYGIYSALTPEDEEWSHYWHSTARYVGYHFVKDFDYILFLDVDEIVEAGRFLEWAQAFKISDFDALRFSSYFYFRDPSYRAIKPFPLNALLVRKEVLESPEMILDVLERMGLYDQIKGRKAAGVMGIDGRPLVHHYSWVRTPAELKQKVRTWGHRHDRDWLKLVEDELAQPFSGTDRVHGFHYEKADPLHDILKEERFPHVEKANRQTLFEKSVRAML